jgi:D-inositol-3-phosphate glycosyltransferase
MHHYDFALCSALAEQGVDVTLFTCDQTVVPEGSPFSVELTFRGVFGEEPAWMRGLRYGLALGRIARRRPRHQPTVVHVHFFHALPLDFAFVAWMRARGCRLVVSAHDVRPFDAKGWSTPFLRRIYSLADVLIAPSRASREALLTLGIHPECVSVIPLGYYRSATQADHPSTAAARTQLGLPADEPVVLFFGQIKEVKGLDVLLHAFSRLLEHRPDARLVIAGTVWKDSWARYAALIEELDLGRRILPQLYHIPDDRVATYFAAANVIALPYRHIYQSAVVMLALSYGCPVVATRVGGLAEVIEDGENGFLVSPDDPDALAAALRRVLDDPPTAKRMGQTGRRMVEERFSWTRIAARTREVYQQALAT